jgi:hypothetical protein
MNSTPEILEQPVSPDTGPNPARVLENHHTQRPIALDGRRSVLFGIPFLAAGVGINLLAFGVIPVHRYVPSWVISVFGDMFLLSGLLFLIHGLHGITRKSRYLSAAAERPGEPWLYDFPWSQEGIAFSAFRDMPLRLLATLFVAAILVPFVWMGLNIPGKGSFLIFSLPFPLVMLRFWYQWTQQLARQLRYNNRFLSYDDFPYFLGGALRARLRAPHHISEIDALTITLRCVQERYITTVRGNERETQVVCYELYKDVTTLTRERLAGYAGGEIPVEFRLPAGQPATSLASTPPVYWEIEARGQSGKISYESYFLVPVYKAP